MKKAKNDYEMKLEVKTELLDKVFHFMVFGVQVQTVVRKCDTRVWLQWNRLMGTAEETK